MQSITPYKPNEKATVCFQKNCMTVYGKSAEIINAIAIVTALAIAIALLAKALK